ncbi:MAG: transglutaminase TgpA family protein [Streptosporangiaceae bacterium]
MNHRLTLAAAVAVILASVSIFSLINGAAWYVQASGAVVIVALAGTLTRLSPVPAAVGASILAVIASVPFLAAWSPYLKATGVGIILLCAASASGLRPLRAVAGLVTYLAALLIYLNLLHAAAQSFLYVIPTPHSVHHLAKLASDGSTAGRFTPPVPGHEGVILLAAGSIGLVAIAVDFLAVRLHRPAIAGLPLLVVFMAPIATTANVRGLASGVAFLLAAIGYLALLSSDGRNRLRGWGRVVTVWHYAGDDERLAGADMGALAATGRRIGLAAVCAALIAPLLVPGLNVHRLFGGHGTGGGGGHGSVGLPNPVAQLHGLLTRSKPRTVLTYHTDFNDPANYLQVYVLNYDTKAGVWDLVTPTHFKQVGRGQLAQAPGLASTTPMNTVSTRISIPRRDGFTGSIAFLPVPYWPMRANVPGDWREAAGTLMIYSSSAPTDGLQYTVTSGQVEPTTGTLAAKPNIPPSISREYMGFQSNVTPKLKEIAQEITRGKTTAFDKAVALEQFFLSSKFSYSVASTGLPNSPRGLLTFLTTDRQGFCQQFAFAMAVLARLIGIPSRVAIGFTAGHERADGTWVVTTADAHAWPELYFSGAGWLRFEPTPGGAGGQQTAVEPAYVAGTTSSGGQKNPNGGSSPTPSTGPTAGATNNIHPRLQGPGHGAGSGGAAGAGHGGPPFGWIILAVLVVTAAGPGTARVITRRRRWRSASGDAGLAGAAWQELCADLDDYGMHCRPSESPRALARRVSANSDLDEQARRAIGRIATVVERARYAPSPTAAGAIRSDVTSVRRALARSSSRGIWLQAVFLPASTLQPLRAWLRQAAGLLTGWTPASGES